MEKALYSQHLQYLKQQNIKKITFNEWITTRFLFPETEGIFHHSIISITGDTCRYYHNQSETIQH